MRPIAVTLLVLPALACSQPCLELAQKLCDCQPTTSLRDQCRQRASADNGSKNPPADAELACASLLSRCDCHQIGTADGKRACGLARQIPDGGAAIDGG
jgi:hypothetical protein